METIENKLALLALENGTVLQGQAIGAVDSVEYTCGEVIFNTAITGYQEIISDPSYCEQIIMFTMPHIGNVGINNHDIESNIKNKIWSNGIIIKSLALQDSNWRSQNILNNYLIENNLIGISGVDTRELTNILRNNGALRSCIYIVNQKNKTQEFQSSQEYIDLIDNLKIKAIQLAKQTKSLENQDLAMTVTTKQQYMWRQPTCKINRPNKNNDANVNNHSVLNSEEIKHHVVVYDFGVKQQILKLLIDRNCKVTVVPANTSIADLLKLKPDGVLLSNGPGDPVACDYAIENTKQLLNIGIPVFGICLGFQILALSLGLKTKKMKFGHHGSNHPVKDLIKNQVLITSQNHGFMVVEESIEQNITITHKSLFDQTIQGLRHNKLPVFGFQGHPEASPGPNDVENLFDVFICSIGQHLSNKLERDIEVSSQV